MRQGLPCQICDEPIDYGLPYLHPRAFEVDEKVPFSRGGSPYDLDNTGPAHRECNQWKSDMTLQEARAKLARKRAHAHKMSTVEGSGKWD